MKKKKSKCRLYGLTISSWFLLFIYLFMHLFMLVEFQNLRRISKSSPPHPKANSSKSLCSKRLQVDASRRPIDPLWFAPTLCDRPTWNPAFGGRVWGAWEGPTGGPTICHLPNLLFLSHWNRDRFCQVYLNRVRFGRLRVSQFPCGLTPSLASYYTQHK